MHPTTSYWPPTTSPACSLGVNEYGARHFGQKPSVRPGFPSRDRPTGEPHDEQNRFSSGTDGFSSTAERGSATGAAGTLVIPAPRCCTRLVAVTNRRVGRLRPARAEPIGVLDSFIEMLLRGPFDPDSRAESNEELTDGSGPGAPQTLQ